MASGRIEEQGISRLQDVTAVGVAISNLACEHVDELDAGMPEVNVRFSIGFVRSAAATALPSMMCAAIF